MLAAPLTPVIPVNRRADLHERQAVLEAELRKVRQAIRDADDRQWLRVLMISARGCTFTAADLLVRAALDPDLAAAVAGRSAKQLGKRLARCVDRDLDGLRVRRVLATADGWVWAIALQPER